MSGETRFGHYQLVRLLGRGGMGQVWLAHDTHTDRDVALKVLPPEAVADEGYRKRFEREARLAAKVRGPHIVPIHTFGELDGRLFIDMEYIEGTDLAEVVKCGPVPPTTAVDLVAQIAAALDTAHAADLVHRDVKPSNVIVLPSGFAYLIDFGIARRHGQTAITTTGAAIGTWAYMAPERFTGQEDARADVYALACVLFECLTGRRPFGETDPAQQMRAHMMTPVPRATALNPEVPDGLDEVIRRGMAKDPDRRYRTAGELASAAGEVVHPTRGVALATVAESPATTKWGAGWTFPLSVAVAEPTRVDDGTLVTGIDQDDVAEDQAQNASGLSRAVGRSRGRIAPKPLVLLAAGVLLVVTGAVGTAVYLGRDDSGQGGVASSSTPAQPTRTVAPGAPRAVTAVVPVGISPSGIAVDPIAETAYVANWGDYAKKAGGSISIIDLRTNQVTTTIEIPHFPTGVAVDSESRKVYVTGSAPSSTVTERSDDIVDVSGSVTVIDARTNKISATLTVGLAPEGIVVDSRSHTAYVANRGNPMGEGSKGSISVIDTRTDAVVSTLKPKELPADVTFDSQTRSLVITQPLSNSVAVVDIATNTTTSINVGWPTYGIDMDSRSGIAYAASDTSLTVIDLRTKTATGTTYLGVAHGLAVDAAGGVIFAVGGKRGTEPYSNAVSTLYVVDIATKDVVASVDVGRGGGSVAVNPTTHIAYVTNRDDNTVSVVAPL
ncbi:serine/threonine-protein kinase [Nocardia sp. NPDC004860]|uniref:serine/threonine-protein kinase n=1 Tax=Nocardia sp. NPDC004860 TaxID=3154557 RepID=UPI0033A55E8D